jgi:hypothetical protein
VVSGGGGGSEVVVSEEATAVAADLSLCENKTEFSQGDNDSIESSNVLFHPLTQTCSLVLVEDPNASGFVCT